MSVSVGGPPNGLFRLAFKTTINKRSVKICTPTMRSGEAMATEDLLQSSRHETSFRVGTWATRISFCDQTSERPKPIDFGSTMIGKVYIGTTIPIEPGRSTYPTHSQARSKSTRIADGKNRLWVLLGTPNPTGFAGKNSS